MIDRNFAAICSFFVSDRIARDPGPHSEAH